MKKNKMLRIASVLLIVTILSTVAISGTFAKYITKYSGNDTARVAKFGFDIVVDGDLFKTQYTSPDGSAVTVKAAADKVVAPGTSSVNEYTIAISGTAEVTTKFMIKLVDPANFSDIILPAGEYADYTTADNDTDKFTLPAPYTPVKFNVVANGMLGTTPINDFEILPSMSLTDFNTAIANGVVPTNSFGGYALALEDGALTFTIPAGKDIDVTFTGGWAWAYEGASYGLVSGTVTPIPAAIVDKADTYLGFQAADGNAQELKFAFEATAVQVD